MMQKNKTFTHTPLYLAIMHVMHNFDKYPYNLQYTDTTEE